MSLSIVTSVGKSDCESTPGWYYHESDGSCDQVNSNKKIPGVSAPVNIKLILGVGLGLLALLSFFSKDK